MTEPKQKYVIITGDQMTSLANCNRGISSTTVMQAAMAGIGIVSLVTWRVGGGTGWVVAHVISLILFCVAGWYRHTWKNMRSELMEVVRKTETTKP